MIEKQIIEAKKSGWKGENHRLFIFHIPGTKIAHFPLEVQENVKVPYKYLEDPIAALSLCIIGDGKEIPYCLLLNAEKNAGLSLN